MQTFRKASRMLAAASLVAIGAASCATAQQPQPKPPLPVEVTAADEAAFASWLKDIRKEARASGVSQGILDQALGPISPNPRIIELNERQPEFTRPVWAYLDSAVSDERVANGMTNLAQNKALLDALEARYGVPGRYVIAIWGIETNYGTITGSHNVFEALATLGFRGRRADYGKSQLLAALTIAQSGVRAPDTMTGSWAGAMGHTQFIPTTYLQHKADGDGDGMSDIWGSPADAFASTANYLASSGWEPGQDWGIEVKVGPTFDWDLADPKARLSINAWAERGLTRPSGEPLPTSDTEARLIAPGGHRGPAFLVFRNFEAILRYNSATAYALAVGHLAERIAGGQPFVQPWPREMRPLSLEENKEIQRRLTDKGFDTKGIDGIVGEETRRALRRFQKTKGFVPDGFPSSEMLDALRES